MQTHGRWIRFLTVGAAGFLVQIALIALMTRVWGWHYLLATLVAMQVVFIQNYVAHSRWTWADRRTPARTGRRPVRYQLAKTVSLAANLLLTTLFVAGAGVPAEAANAIAVVVCSVLNFMMADRLVFT